MSTEQTPEESKAEKFKQDPSKFFHEDQIVMAVLRGSSGEFMTCHGAVSRENLEKALTRLTYKTMMVFQSMDMERLLKQAEKKKSRIITNGR